MKKTLRDTRETFKNFFEKNKHKVVSSSPLIPQNYLQLNGEIGQLRSNNAGIN